MHAFFEKLAQHILYRAHVSLTLLLLQIAERNYAVGANIKMKRFIDNKLALLKCIEQTDKLPCQPNTNSLHISFFKFLPILNSTN